MKHQPRGEASARRESISFPPFRLEPQNEQLWDGERPVPLKPKTFAILSCLLDQPGQLISRDELLARVWGDVHLSDGVLKTQIAELRQSLDDCARTPRFIETVHRRGYRFIGRVERRSAEPKAPLVTGAFSPRPSFPAPVATYFVGRETELSFMRARWALARAGERQTLFVEGEAGIGKTVLVNAVLQKLLQNDTGVLILWGQCIDQYGAGEAYLPIVEALRRACLQPGNEWVCEALRQNAPAWLPLLPNTVASGVAEAPGASLPGRMLREMAEALEALARQTPLLLLIEDLHWADFSTLDLVAYLAQRSDPARLFVLGTCRPLASVPVRLGEIVDALKARNRCSELSVPRLSQRAVVEYLGQRFAQHRLPDAVPQLIHKRTDGNPLFMVGVIDGWLERGLLRTSGGTCEVAATSSELTRCIPESFVRVVERELERATPLERRVLEAASVAGNEFSTAAVAAGLAEDSEQVEEICLRWARRGQFLRSLGKVEWPDGTLAERCQFLHVLNQQITYRQLGASRQAQLHQRIGERLEVAYAENAASMAPELALHFQQSRDYQRAVHYLRSAGERALGRAAHREAIEHLTRALELVKKLPETPDRAAIDLDLRILLLAPLRATKGYGADELEHAYTAALRLCEERGSERQLLLILEGMGAFHILRGTPAPALQTGQRLLELAEQAGDANSISSANAVLGAAYHFLGQHHAAQLCLARTIAFHDTQCATSPGHTRDHHALTSLTSLDQGFGSRVLYAYSSCMLGYLDQASEAGEKSLALARALGNPFALAQVMDFCAFISMLRGDFDRAREHTLALAAFSEAQGFELYSSAALLHSADVRLEVGDWEAGVELMDRALAAFKVTGSRVYTTLRVAMLAHAHGRLGHVHIGLRLIDETLEGASVGEHLWDAELLRIKAELLLLEAAAPEASHQHASRQMECPAAEAQLLRAFELAKAQSSKLLELRSAMSLARYWKRCGDSARGYALLREVYGWFNEGLQTADLKKANALLAELQQRPGRKK